MRRIRLLEEAAQEAIEAAAWYEQERTGLGRDFARAIESALDLLQEDIIPLAPMPGAAGARGAKRLILKRFPYDVVAQERLGEILVVAVAHHSRRPGYWRHRLRT
jgi:toxin ParE1/3/4